MECIGQSLGIGRAIVWPVGQEAGEAQFQGFRQVGPQAAQPWRVAVVDVLQQLAQAVGLMGPSPGEQLKPEHTQRIEVSRCAAGFAGQGFRRHVGGCAFDHACG